MNAERLRHLLDYDPITGNFTRRVTSGKARAGKPAGSLYALGYVYICVDGVRRGAHRLAWLHYHGVMPPEQVDHINGKKDDNRISNLRLATHAQNNRNRPAQANNTSGFKGVRQTAHGTWNARITVDHQEIHIGNYQTIEEARAAYDAAALMHHGDFASPNLKTQENAK